MKQIILCVETNKQADTDVGYIDAVIKQVYRNDRPVSLSIDFITPVEMLSLPWSGTEIQTEKPSCLYMLWEPLRLTFTHPFLRNFLSISLNTILFSPFVLF